MQRAILELSGIPYDVLGNPDAVRRYCVAQRFSWAAKRTATRVEDDAYCLLGLFNVHMPLLYGERDKAFERLQRQIIQQTQDESILVWRHDAPAGQPFAALSVLASSPAAFADSGRVTPMPSWRIRHAERAPSDEHISLHRQLPSQITHWGLQMLADAHRYRVQWDVRDEERDERIYVQDLVSSSFG